jgi:hypothetical protein
MSADFLHTYEDWQRRVNKRLTSLERRRPAALDTTAGIPAVPYDTDWIVPTLVNGWGPYPGGGVNTTLAYRRRDGFVVIKGLVVHPAAVAEQAIFMLPAGFRPLQQRHRPVVCTSNTFGVVGITNTAVIYKGGNATNWFALDDLIFLAEQ